MPALAVAPSSAVQRSKVVSLAIGKRKASRKHIQTVAIVIKCQLATRIEPGNPERAVIQPRQCNDIRRDCGGPEGDREVNKHRMAGWPQIRMDPTLSSFQD